MRIVATDPLTVIAPAGPRGRPALVRIGAESARVLGAISSTDGFAATSGDSLVLAGADWPSATEFDLEDGSITIELPATGAEQWIPVTRLGDELLGVTGVPDAIRAGHGLLTLASLTDDSVTTLGELAANPVKSDPTRAMLIDDVLLVPGRGNAQVVAYRLTLPD